MPRPKGSLNSGKKTPVLRKINHLNCGACNRSRNDNEFYSSSNPLHKTGKLPFCKKCIKDMCYDSRKKLDLEKIKRMLQVVDRPFIYEILKISTEAKGDTIGCYFRNLQLPQFKHLGYSDSIFEAQCKYDETPKQWDKKDEEFVVTNEIEEFFGSGFSTDEYKSMHKKYNFLKNNYPETTNMHIEALKTYVRYKVKEEFATAKGDVIASAKWAELSGKAATSAKINPSQLSKADLQGGLSSVSELMKAVEQAVDIIPILPQYKFRPNDALDFVIWCYINYARDLKGMPLCEYKDVYSFYDKRKKEYIDQYGDTFNIFKEDPTEENREKIDKFIVRPESILEVGDNNG